MEPISLGHLITEGARRDAIHIAIMPVVAAENLQPGDRVGIHDRNRRMVGMSRENAIGIIDPFLWKGPRMGEECWMLLFPNTVTSLRHEWEHPSLAEDSTPSEVWMRDFATRIDVPFLELIQAGRDYLRVGSYIVKGDESFLGLWDPAYWIHFEVITGTVVPLDIRRTFFSCSC